MAQAYSPGLTVTDSIVLKKERILPLKGKVLVKKGDKVKAEDLVAETLLPGKVVPFNIANKLGTTANLVSQFLKIKAGDKITKGDVIAETKGFFGLFKTVVKAPIDGEVENISKITGQMLLREPRIPVQVKAFIDGIVVEVIPEEGVIVENKSAYIQGIFGIGGERFGEIKMLVDSLEQSLDVKMIDDSCKDKIIVCGTMVTYAVIKKAQEVGVSGIITGGIDDRDLKQLLGYNIGVAITGHEEVGLTIVVTEGFGKIDMAKKTYGLLKQFDGHKASIHGITQIRAGVMRPEIIIPIKFKEEELTEPEARMSMLEIGTTIRVIRQPNFGVIGKVTGLPEQLTKVESETLVRILEAELENGEKVTIPRANVEVIED
jgi:predicted transcriptional regulator